MVISKALILGAVLTFLVLCLYVFMLLRDVPGFPVAPENEQQSNHPRTAALGWPKNQRTPPTGGWGQETEPVQSFSFASGC